MTWTPDVYAFTIIIEPDVTDHSVLSSPCYFLKMVIAPILCMRNIWSF